MSGDTMNPEGADTSDLSSQNLESGAVDDRPPLEEPVESSDDGTAGVDPDIAPETSGDGSGDGVE